MNLFLYSPFEIFELNIYFVLNFFSLRVFVTNFMFSAYSVLLLLCGLWFIFNNNSIIKSYFYFGFIKFFDFILNMLKLQLNSIRSLRMLPLLMTTVLIIFFFNFSSLIAFNFSTTAHIFLTLFFSFSIFFSFVILSFLNYQFSYFTFFVPKNINKNLVPFLIFIEIISFLIRPFSLAVRLFANMLAGHTLLHLFGNFFLFILNNYTFLFILPFFICLLIFLLEFAVAIIQTYVFLVLLIIYLNDSYVLH
jgi:ATP synthase subunit 6